MDENYGLLYYVTWTVWKGAQPSSSLRRLPSVFAQHRLTRTEATRRRGQASEAFLPLLSMRASVRLLLLPCPGQRRLSLERGHQPFLSHYQVRDLIPHWHCTRRRTQRPTTRARARRTNHGTLSFLPAEQRGTEAGSRRRRKLRRANLIPLRSLVECVRCADCGRVSRNREYAILRKV